MICAAEVRADLNTVLAIKQDAPWHKSRSPITLYTCTYKLPMGTLVLSVKELPDRASTDSYYQTLQQPAR